MKILYAAIDQVVPGSIGGSIHVEAVARGLAALGHDVHVIAAPGGRPPAPGPVIWHAMRPPLGNARLRLFRAARVRVLVERLQPDVVMERYHNFGGEAIQAAVRRGRLAVLEVNAPIVDHPGSWKRRLDRALIVEPMRRWREWQCRAADLLITPSPEILPAAVRPEQVVELEWGADTERFHPNASGPIPFRRPTQGSVAVFAGAFRAWHGAIHLVNAIRTLRARGRTDVHAVLVGDGPELPRARAAARDLDGITFTGALPHDAMPACLAAADIGVAPFDVAAHPPLQLGFFWSPLKVFEYMASGLPVVAPAIPRLARLVEHGREGLLYADRSPEALADSLIALLEHPLRRRAMGEAARARAVRDFSWAAHCRALDGAFHAALAARRPTADRRCGS